MVRCTRSLAIALALLLLPLTPVGAADPSAPWIDLHTIPGFELGSVAPSAHPETGDPIQVVTGRIGETEVTFQIQFYACRTRRACSTVRLYRSFDIGQHYMRFKEGIRNLSRFETGNIIGQQVDLAQRSGAAAVFGIGDLAQDRVPLVVVTVAAGDDVGAWRDYIRRAARVATDEEIAELAPPSGLTMALPYKPVASTVVHLDDLTKWDPELPHGVLASWIDVFSIPEYVGGDLRFANDGTIQLMYGRIGWGSVAFSVERLDCTLVRCDDQFYDESLQTPALYEKLGMAPVKDVQLFRGHGVRGGQLTYNNDECWGFVVALPRLPDGTYPLRVLADACDEAREVVAGYVRRMELSTTSYNGWDRIIQGLRAQGRR